MRNKWAEMRVSTQYLISCRRTPGANLLCDTPLLIPAIAYARCRITIKHYIRRAYAQFLLCDSMLALYVLTSCVRPSVCTLLLIKRSLRKHLNIGSRKHAALYPTDSGFLMSYISARTPNTDEVG